MSFCCRGRGSGLSLAKISRGGPSLLESCSAPITRARPRQHLSRDRVEIGMGRRRLERVEYVGSGHRDDAYRPFS